MTVIAGARDMGELIVLIPHLLGYHPEPGLVLVGLVDRRVGPLLRLELPDDHVEDPVTDPCLEPALAQLSRSADLGLVLVFEQWAGQSRPMERLIRGRAASTGLHLDKTVRVLDGRWCWVVDGVTQHGGPVPAASRVPAAAEFVVRGSAPLSSRGEVTALITRQIGDLAQVATLLARARRRTLLVEAVRRHGPRSTDLQDALAAWRHVLTVRETAQGLPAPTVATAVRALDDVELRDELYAWISPRFAPEPTMLPARVRGAARAHLGPRTGFDDREVARRLLLLAQHTPGPDRAPVLTALGLCSWSRGDGALAREAVVAALEVRPDYTMAQLLLSAIRHAVRPPGMHDEDDALAC